MPPAHRDYRGHVGRRIALRDLDVTLLRIGFTEIHGSERRVYEHVDQLADAQGIRFLCPKCFTMNGGPKGTHGVVCWFRHRGVPDTELPLPGRWTPGGTSIDDLTFVPGEPAMSVSVLLTGGCGWHGYVRNGAVDSDT